MSWIEDNAFEGYWPNNPIDPLWFRNETWRSKTGDIELRDMTDAHLINAYNMCGEEDMQEAMMKEMTYRLFELKVMK